MIVRKIIESSTGTHMQSSFRTLPLLVLFMCPPASALAETETQSGIGLQLGKTDAESQEDFELDKSGSSSIATFNLSWHTPHETSWNLGLGIHSYDLDGNSSGRKQEIKTNNFALFGGYLWHFGAWEAGLIALADIGEAATLKVQDLEAKRKTAISLGPQIGYRWRGEHIDHVALLTAFWDTNVQKQQNRSILLGYQIWFKTLEKSTSNEIKEPLPVQAVTITPPQPEAPAPITDPAPILPEARTFVVRFKPDVFQFEFNKDTLIKASRSNVKAISEILVRHRQEWESIEIAGHADGKASKRNTELSELRAKAVLKGLLAAGVDEKSVTAKGYGVSQPVPGLAPKSPEHRRVDLKISGAKNAEALTSDLAPFLTLDHN